MLKIFINFLDVTDHLDDGSLSIVSQIQNKADSCKFSLRPGVTQPVENEDLKIYDVVELVSASGTALVVKDRLGTDLSIFDFNKFRSGQVLWLGVDEATLERCVISSIVAGSAGQANITLEKAIVNAHSAGELTGRLIFGGTLTYVNISNTRLLNQVEYDVTATDYTKIFDRKNINDSWQNVDARYVINDFCNTTVNLTTEIDDMDYGDNAAVQAEWLESSDGTDPQLNVDHYIQGTSAVDFLWTNSGGTAIFTASPESKDISQFTGVSTGQPTKGNLTFWYLRDSAVGITNIKIRIGSGASDYLELTLVPEADLVDHFISLPMAAGTVTGTPDWTAMDFLQIRIAETTSSLITIDDVRVTAEGSFTLYNVEESTEFEDVRASFKKPTVFVDQMADSLSFSWFIDYEKDIHFFQRTNNLAPFAIDDTSDNFNNLVVDIDTSQLKNRQVVRGGVKTSETFYTQVVEGDDSVREWLMKSKFAGLTIKLDDNTSTDTMEATTSTTTVKATAHGLITGDYIVNRSRDNAVRQITFVDANTFTVEAVPSQASGDVFSKFATDLTVGVENLTDETTVDYLSNFNEKSIRASEQTATLTPGEFLLFTYHEIVPIRVQISDFASITAMKAIVGGDGIFDGAVITDTSISSTQEARDRGLAEINQFSNPIVKISFKTNHEGLESGQLLSITDTNKTISDDFLIQRVKTDYKTKDFPVFDLQCASTLFGIIEYFQKLSQAISERQIGEDEVIDQIVSEDATINIGESHQLAPTHLVTDAATITVGESNTVTERDITASPNKWEPDATDNRWNLAQWG